MWRRRRHDACRRPCRARAAKVGDLQERDRLVDLVGRTSAANILGVTIRELDKLVVVFELPERSTNLREPGAAITWARELLGVSESTAMG